MLTEKAMKETQDRLSYKIKLKPHQYIAPQILVSRVNKEAQETIKIKKQQATLKNSHKV